MSETGMLYTPLVTATVCNNIINKTESCQRWFTSKRIKGLTYGLDYSQRLTFLGLETLEVRRIKYDQILSSNCNLFSICQL